jgi:hypothetical protein
MPFAPPEITAILSKWDLAMQRIPSFVFGPHCIGSALFSNPENQMQVRSAKPGCTPVMADFGMSTRQAVRYLTSQWAPAQTSLRFANTAPETAPAVDNSIQISIPEE